jgi:hypothetical protein
VFIRDHRHYSTPNNTHPHSCKSKMFLKGSNNCASVSSVTGTIYKQIDEH